jgi:hypothetical protein
VIRCDVRVLSVLLRAVSVRVVKDSALCRNFLESDESITTNLQILSNDMIAASRVLETYKNEFGL